MEKPSSEDQELVDLNREFGEAEKRRDEVFFRRVLSDDLVFRRASGARVTKDIYVTDLLKPENVYAYLNADDIDVISTGQGSAFVSLLVWAKGNRGGVGFAGVFRNTRIFEKRDGNWQCTVWFNSREGL